MKNMRFVFGIGTGRCGTLSLARLLNSQPDAKVTHEMRPLLCWNASQNEKRRIASARLERLAQQPDARLFGDVASFYLPYLPFLLEAHEEVRVVCLRRPRQEVIASFTQWLERTESLPVNHWLEQPWKHGRDQRQFHSLVWSRIFPKYADVSLEEGIGRYWDEYYAEVEKLQDRFQGRVLTIETHELNDEPRQRELLRFCGVEAQHQRIGVSHENVSATIAHRRRNTTFASPDSPANCVVLVPYAERIGESCEEGLRQLENKGYEVRRIHTANDETLARNRAVIEALRDGFLETMWIDSSVRFDPDSVATLRTHQSDLACVPVFGRNGPKRSYAPSPANAAIWLGQSGEVVNVESAALSFLHVRRYVYDAIAAQLNLPLVEEPGGAFVPFFVPTYRAVEDGYRFRNAAETFCGQARECGFSILADCRIRLWNTESYAYSWEESGLARAAHEDMVLRFQ